jgi:outer membrane immunogenic protein
MKSFKAAASLLLLSSASAVAADLPSMKSAPVATPVLSWTGAYDGLNAGGTWGNSNNLNATTWNIYQPAGSADYTAAALLSGNQQSSVSSGFIGGGQIGYNWQGKFSNLSFVSGVEADIQGIAGSGGNANRWNVAPNAGLSGGVTSNVLVPLSLTSNIQGNSQLSWLGTVRGRLGYLAMPNLLIYGTGGLAYGSYSSNFQTSVFWQQQSGGSANFIQIGQNSYSNTMVGWTAGGGAEWMFMPNWSVKAEYLYYDLGKTSASVVNPFYGIDAASGRNGLESITNFSSRVSGNIVRAGVNYHFNFANVAPVVAKF